MNSRFVFVPAAPAQVLRGLLEACLFGTAILGFCVNHSRVAGRLHAEKSIFTKIKAPNIFALHTSKIGCRCALLWLQFSIKRAATQLQRHWPLQAIT
jgi:hypothetical protein